MPQIRAVMSGTSVKARPAQKRLEEARRLVDAELDLGDLVALEPHVHRPLALDPGEVVGADHPLAASLAHGVSLACAEGRSRGVEGAVDAHRSSSSLPSSREAGVERGRVGRLHRPVAAVAAAVVGGADRAAAGVRDRPEAGRAVGHHHAHGAPPLALDADAVRADPRPPAGRGAPLITSSSWCLLIGHPCSSKSTGTWSLIGVEVASVEMYSGDA